VNNKNIRTLNGLLQQGLINESDISELAPITDQFALAITGQMHQLIDQTNPDDPIAKQFIPHIDELTRTPTDSIDPIGDETHGKVKGIIHRYPDRCLLTPVHVCAVYCRFCFRRENIGATDKTMSATELDAAYDYINTHPAIWEVILSGGDPLILKPAALKNIISRLSAIEHVNVIRIHTRIPVVDSLRVNNELLQALASDKAVYIVLHANHAKEFTPAAIAACKQIVNAGIPMLAQTVLLKDINDDIDTLSELMRCFIKHRIKPYYLHHADLARGTAHFRTTIAKGQALVKELRGRFSGLCQPTYVLDIPGGYGKIPLHPSYLHPKSSSDGNESFQVDDYCGQQHTYPPDPLQPQ
jgi:lysine 2,3-aminomutase